MKVCDKCANMDGRSVEVLRIESLTLIGVGECNGVLALEHYRCDECGAVMARQFMGNALERVWTVIDGARA